MDNNEENYNGIQNVNHINKSESCRDCDLTVRSLLRCCISTGTCIVNKTGLLFSHRISVYMMCKVLCGLSQANYAQHSSACVQRVKTVYQELDLRDVYVKYEDDSYSSLVQLIDSLTGTLPRDMFIAYARKIYKRTK